MQFDETTDPISVALFAVIDDEADPNIVREWLADAAQRVRTDVGVVASISVGTRQQTTLQLLETSYSADLSQLTWAGEDPTGAA